MIKNLLCFFLFAIAVEGFCQDSIVNYLDNKGKITTKVNARKIEVITQKDSIWVAKQYYRNGQIFRLGNFRSINKRHPVGNFFEFHKNGKIKKIITYNNKNKKDGKFKTLFYNGVKDTDGFYTDGLKEGVWNYYHINGEIAARIIYKKNNIIKSVVYDKPGVISKKPLISFKKAEFKGGIQAFYNKIKELTNSITYKVSGTIHISYILDIYGRITNVTIDEDIPKKLRIQIVTFFENIEGWSPMIDMGRFHPKTFEVPLNFNK